MALSQEDLRKLQEGAVVKGKTRYFFRCSG